jgi:hypothetical protein
LILISVNWFQPALFGDLDLLRPFLDLLRPFLDLLGAFLDLLRPFLDLLSPFLDLLRPFLDLLRPFLDLLRPFLDLLRPLLDLLLLDRLRPFLDLLLPFLDLLLPFLDLLLPLLDLLRPLLDFDLASFGFGLVLCLHPALFEAFGFAAATTPATGLSTSSLLLFTLATMFGSASIGWSAILLFFQFQNPIQNFFTILFAGFKA